ncbi:MAG: hypothetical protein JST21_13775, partial [Bacteroidetes bacterium]|nr:hypothetical protein [Bacteroidota bacterium]
SSEKRGSVGGGGEMNAQLTPCDTANLDCSLDLTAAIFNDIHIDTLSYAKNPLPALLADIKYKNDVYGQPQGCTPPETDECLNDGSALKYYVYYPKDHNYAACPLKAVVLAHSGGFAECSNFDQPGINKISLFLAQRGFVVFNVEYRRGIMLDSSNLSNKSVQQYKAPYIAEQDIRGFFRSMIKRERNKSQFNDFWSIDTNTVYMGGMSAGDYAVINTAWYSKSMNDSLYAPPITSGNIQYVLGKLDVDFYYGEPDLDFYSFYQPKIKAIFSMWGAAPMPWNPYKNINQQPAFFADAHLTPAIFFHGYQDATFPFINRTGFSQDVNLSPSTPSDELQYNSTDFCIRNDKGPFKVDSSASIIDITNGSSYNMYRILKYYSVQCEIYVDCSMKHGLDGDGPGYGSNFGSSATNQEQTELYIAQRFAVFIQKLLHPPAIYGNTIFVDCENTSKNCTTNTNCTNRSCGELIDFP